MLMMLAPFWGFGKNPLQLMLMMLALFWGVWEKPIAADAHDAGLVFFWGGGGGLEKNQLQLMLMMLALFWGGLGKTHCS